MIPTMIESLTLGDDPSAPTGRRPWWLIAIAAAVVASFAALAMAGLAEGDYSTQPGGTGSLRRQDTLLHGMAPSIGTVRDAFDCALAGTTIGLYKHECFRRTDC